MHLIIISCTPRLTTKSNTDKILNKFRQGYESLGNTTETFYLYKRNEWNVIREKFYSNNNILFAVPLYVECIPGIMVEFLETLNDKKDENTSIGFILQGGFPEASQLRCGEEYLEILPSFLGCKYSGTLIKGGMFEVSLVDGKMRDKMIQPFYEMGEIYARNNYFEKSVVDKFAKPEYFSKKMMCLFLITSPLRKIFMNIFSKKLGCENPLDYKVYTINGN